MRKQIAAANWKMNLSLEQALTLTNELQQQSYESTPNRMVLMAVPFPYLIQVKASITNPFFSISAQNIAATANGAYTGEVSAEMLKSIGIEYTLIGHSERRDYFNENHEVLKRKVDMALQHGIKPVFCCGESLSIREAGSQNEFVANQLKASLFHLETAAMKDFIIAYEPVWAIGTGKTATAEQAEEMHAFIRQTITEKYGADIADSVSILYGGSVKASNAAEIFGKPNVDGGLVGGASLVASEFSTIIRSLK
jgi:triosephosphate isomerase